MYEKNKTGRKDFSFTDIKERFLDTEKQHLVLVNESWIYTNRNLGVVRKLRHALRGFRSFVTLIFKFFYFYEIFVTRGKRGRKSRFFFVT